MGLQAALKLTEKLESSGFAAAHADCASSVQPHATQSKPVVEMRT